ncbi:hypothetical protein GZH79_12950 [Loktanella sp. SALINAS62]|nr:hypothetical protein [Loktanella sp. SALINAS62]MBS1303226.1 hypothetical protein [Loktanella sp. SALINAS62]
MALLSYLFIACRDSTARILLACVLLALGPFEHGVLTMLHLSFGVSFQAETTWIDIAQIFGVSVVGNLLGGVGLVTMSHAAQAKGAS